jgi:hypothetical protein
MIIMDGPILEILDKKVILWDSVVRKARMNSEYCKPSNIQQYHLGSLENLFSGLFVTYRRLTPLTLTICKVNSDASSAPSYIQGGLLALAIGEECVYVVTEHEHIWLRQNKKRSKERDT